MDSVRGIQLPNLVSLDLAYERRRVAHSRTRTNNSYSLASRQASTMQNFDANHANFRGDRNTGFPPDYCELRLLRYNFATSHGL